ncbi:MAG: efflux RND transporter periplasmic adaptor subunit [candidate division KSB1 bacterium]|nr:efflux RND transporter periplasmic adaptor subunit [candidate division KSB1 bacterium]
MKLKRKRWIWIAIIAVLVIVAILLAANSAGKKRNQKVATVKVERRTIVEKALAIGTIDPETEIAIKSKISGVVQKMFVDAGSYVRAGDPMLEIRPDPTPLELAEAKRNVEMEKIAVENARREYERAQQLKDKGFTSDKEFENSQKQFEQAKVRLDMAQERLALLEKGKIKIANANIETIIKSPADGFVLEKMTDVGDPIVPLTSYQAGTVLFTIADMKKLIFKGTVDEIDVGKLKEGMMAEIQIGALPGKPVPGKLSEISLKARKEDNKTVFPVEIVVETTGNQVLRAGYSANANIIIQKKDSVLAIPERVVTFRNDSAFVNIPQGAQGKKEVYIQTGLSDAIYIEVISGLKEGEEVLEKEVKPIT